jgi:two-component Ni(II)/redox sensor kinase NrsS
MNSQQLFRRSRLRLAGWYALVMGGILSLSGFGMARALVRSNWVALEREIESIAGTLHDSLEPILPPSENPTAVLQQIFPDLCTVEQPCEPNPLLIQRHTLGISDRTTYYIRVFDDQANLLAFSPNQPQPLSDSLNSAIWQTLQSENGDRYRQFTTILHTAAHTHAAGEVPHEHPPWGYLQVGRTLTSFDAELHRLRWILVGSLSLALGLIAIASWGLSGLAMQPIYQSYLQQQQFTANASHELRSPLASLLATVEAMLRLPPNQQQDVPAMLHTLERQGRRLSQLVADLLLLTSLEQDRSPKPPQPCCLNDIIADLTEEFLELATASDVHLSSQIPDGEIYVLGHESQLYRLVSNLIANALQYTSAGGSVLVSLAAHDRTAAIAVKDTGIGIPVEEQSRIFERFYRVDCDRSRQTGGTGLGLAIAWVIAHTHGGTIQVKSEVRQGSCFNIQLPKAAPIAVGQPDK